MRHLLLTALLLASCGVLAQTAPAPVAVPAAPVPATVPVTTAPATVPVTTPAASSVTPTDSQSAAAPASAPSAPAPTNLAPNNIAPSSPASSNPAPVQLAPTATAPVLTLSAPVGSSVELETTTRSNMSISGVQVSAAPGKHPSQKTLNEARRALTQGLSAAAKQGAAVIKGKSFLKVTGRTPAGDTTLLITVVQNLPAPAGKAVSPLTMKITQTLTPGGKSTTVKLESDNPQVNALFKTLTSEKLAQLGEQGGGSFSGIYGVPLTVGQARTSTAKVDMQSLLSSVLGTFAGAKGQQMLGEITATPLIVTNTSTYRGLNAAGDYTFGTVSNYGVWKVSINPTANGQVPFTMQVALAGGKTNSEWAYRTNGLPSSAVQNSAMKINMTMIIEDVQVKLTMNTEQSTALKAR